jgi:nucleoside-diphosphate-sugar epimerase
VPLLNAAGYEVHATTTNDAPGHETPKGMYWHQVDLLESGQVAQLVSEVQPTHLLHFAWCRTLPGKFWTDADNFRWVQASLALLQEFAANGGQRAVLAGTCAEYDWNYGYCSEAHTPLRPATLYGTCKHSLQLLLDAFAAQTGVNAAWGRLFFLYGPHEYSNRLVASVIRSLLQGVPARCSSGEQIRDFLHIEDAAAAFVALLESEVSGPVNIASGQPIAVKDVALKIGELLQRRDLIQLGALPAAPGEPPLLVADVRRLHDEVGWAAQYNLESGLSQTINWWQRRLEEES